MNLLLIWNDLTMLLSKVIQITMIDPVRWLMGIWYQANYRCNSIEYNQQRWKHSFLGFWKDDCDQLSHLWHLPDRCQSKSLFWRKPLNRWPARDWKIVGFEINPIYLMKTKLESKIWQEVWIRNEGKATLYMWPRACCIKMSL